MLGCASQTSVQRAAKYFRTHTHTHNEKKTQLNFQDQPSAREKMNPTFLSKIIICRRKESLVTRGNQSKRENCAMNYVFMQRAYRRCGEAHLGVRVRKLRG